MQMKMTFLITGYKFWVLSPPPTTKKKYVKMIFPKFLGNIENSYEYIVMRSFSSIVADVGAGTLWYFMSIVLISIRINIISSP